MTNYLDKDYENIIENIKTMSENELDLLAYELRAFLIDKVSKTGGHLASNLGVVELTIALHKVFDSPKDKLIWDVGHQSYVHKIITGRKNGFDSLRQFGGMSGFPKKDESEHDILDAGHSSNSISFGLGLAEARDINKENHDVITIIGDGALTGGMAYEALNNAGHSKTSSIVILNDNEMSISENTGGITSHLGKLRTAKSYLEFKKNIRKGLTKIPGVGKNIYSGFERIKDAIKYTLLSGVIFEELGFTYLGPIDGHNIHELVYVMNRAKQINGPVFIHVITKKGKGLKCAEVAPGKFHGIGPFNPSTGNPLTPSTTDTYSDVFGNKLVDLAKADEKIVAVTAAMCDGTGLNEFADKYPDRFFDVGIAEQHAVTFAAGLAASGLKPFIPIYSTFVQRAYDQIIMDIALQKLPVTLCLDRGGIVGADGETHHGVYDLSFLMHVPNINILAPKDKIEFEAMLEYTTQLNEPTAIRYPRGSAPNLSKISNNYDITDGVETLVEGTDICIIGTGRMVDVAYKVSEKLKEKNINCKVINLRVIKPLDEKSLCGKIEKINIVITLEDNALNGGIGSIISQLLHKKGLTNINLYNIGWPNQFIEHGSIADLDKKYGLDVDSITNKAIELVSN